MKRKLHFLNKTVEVGDHMVVDDETFAKLKAINLRLYDDRPISDDQRRDIANAMRAVLDSAFKYEGA
jgi:hypothetical protein